MQTGYSNFVVSFGMVITNKGSRYNFNLFICLVRDNLLLQSYLND